MAIFKSNLAVQTEEMTPVKKPYLFAAGLFFHSQELQALPRMRGKEFLHGPVSSDGLGEGG